MKLANDIAELLQKALDEGALKGQPLAHALAVGKLTMWHDSMADAVQIAKAREFYATDTHDVEIDDSNVQTSQADQGVWVSAWVWVPDDSADDEDFSGELGS